MQLPISIPLSVISCYIEENYIGLLYAGVTTDWTGGDTHIEVSKIGEVTLSAQQNRLLVSMPLEIVMDIRKNDPGIINVFKSIGGLKQIRFSINVSFLFRPNWAKGWQLNLVAEPDFEWIAKPRIASVLKVSIAAWIGPAIRQAIRKQAVIISDKIVEGMDLEKQIPIIWANIQQPVLINEAHQIWLRLIPGQVLHRTDIRCSGRNLLMMLEMPEVARLDFRRPEKKVVSPLPVVMTGFSLPRNSSNALDWESDLPFAWLTSQMEEFRRTFFSLNQVEIQAMGEQLLISGLLRLGTKGTNIKRKVVAEVRLSIANPPQHIGAKVIRLELPASLRWMRVFLRRKIDTILNQLILNQIEYLVQELESSLAYQQVGDDWSLSGTELRPTVSSVTVKPDSIQICGELYGKVGLSLDRL